MGEATHMTRPMVIDGESVPVDRKIYGLIKYLNSLAGVGTHFCCEGGPENGVEFQAYVSISGPMTEAFMCAWMR